MKGRPTSFEAHRAIVGLAAAQHGFLTRGQLLCCGFTDYQIQARIRSRRLIPTYHGVYSVAPWQVSQKGRWLAAVMAAGPAAVLSHHSAAALLNLAPARREIHVLKRGAHNRIILPTADHPGTGDRVVVHSCRRLGGGEIVKVSGIPTTGFVRTTIDLAGGLDRHQLDEHLADADRHGLLHLNLLEAEAARWRGKRGMKRLRRVLQGWHPASDAAMSRFEKDFVARMLEAGAPRPQVNPLLGDRLVDCLWEDLKVMIELDGTTYHADPATQIRDARRDREHTLAGYQVNRIKLPEFRDHPQETIAQSLGLLRQRGWRP